MKKSLHIFFSALFLLTMLVGTILCVSIFFNETPEDSAALELSLFYNVSAEKGAIKKVATQNVSGYQQNIMLPSVPPGKYHAGIVYLDSDCKSAEQMKTLNVFSGQNKNLVSMNINCSNNAHTSGHFYIYLKGQDSKISLYEISNNSRKAKNIASKKISVTGTSDNKRLTFSAGGNIAVLDIRNADLRYLTKKGKDKQPSWSPDGNTIAFSSSRDGSDEIYSINADGSNLRRLTNNSYSDSSPTWSPEGLKIAFNSNRDGDTEIFVLYPKTKKVRQVTNNSHQDYVASWSPSGKSFIVLSEGWFGFNKIRVVGFNGHLIRRITYFASDINETGYPSHKSYSYMVRYTNVWGSNREQRLSSLMNRKDINKSYLTQLLK